VGRVRSALAGPLRLAVLLFGTSLIVFCFVRLSPSPAAAGATPIHLQYVQFLRRIAGGDLGVSAAYKEPLAEALLSGLATTLVLLAAAAALSALLALVLARLAAASEDGAVGRLVGAYVALGRAAPVVWLGLLAAAFLGDAASGAVADRPGVLPGRALALLLAALVMALVMAPRAIRRLARELLRQRYAEHVAAARSRGLPERLVRRRLGLGRALNPAAARIADSLGAFIGTAVAVEKVFALPGLGRLLIDSILAPDYLAAGLSAWILAVVLMLLRQAAALAWPSP